MYFAALLWPSGCGGHGWHHDVTAEPGMFKLAGQCGHVGWGTLATTSSSGRASGYIAHDCRYNQKLEYRATHWY